MKNKDIFCDVELDNIKENNPEIFRGGAHECCSLYNKKLVAHERFQKGLIKGVLITKYEIAVNIIEDSMSKQL